MYRQQNISAEALAQSVFSIVKRRSKKYSQ